MVRLPWQHASSLPGSRGAQELAFPSLWVQPWLSGSVGKWLQSSPAGKRTSFPWDGRLAAAATCWLELPLEKPRRACWLIAPRMRYLRHRLGLFSVPRKHSSLIAPADASPCRQASMPCFPGTYAPAPWHSCRSDLSVLTLGELLQSSSLVRTLLTAQGVGYSPVTSCYFKEHLFWFGCNELSMVGCVCLHLSASVLAFSGHCRGGELGSPNPGSPLAAGEVASRI